MVVVGVADPFKWKNILFFLKKGFLKNIRKIEIRIIKGCGLMKDLGIKWDEKSVEWNHRPYQKGCGSYSHLNIRTVSGLKISANLSLFFLSPIFWVLVLIDQLNMSRTILLTVFVTLIIFTSYCSGKFDYILSSVLCRLHFSNRAMRVSWTTQERHSWSSTWSAFTERAERHLFLQW